MLQCVGLSPFACAAVCLVVPVVFLMHITINLLSVFVLRVLHGSTQHYGGAAAIYFSAERGPDGELNEE